MNVLLLEEDLIVKKDIEIRLRNRGYEVSSDPLEGGFDHIIVGQLFFLERIRRSYPFIMYKAQLIFFITSIEYSTLCEFYRYNDPVILQKPAQVDLLLDLLTPVKEHSL